MHGSMGNNFFMYSRKMPANCYWHCHCQCSGSRVRAFILCLCGAEEIKWENDSNQQNESQCDKCISIDVSFVFVDATILSSLSSSEFIHSSSSSSSSIAHGWWWQRKDILWTHTYYKYHNIDVCICIFGYWVTIFFSILILNTTNPWHFRPGP